MDSSPGPWLTADDGHAIALSLASALVAVALDLVPGVALAWLLARRRWPGKPLIETLVALPLVLPPVIAMAVMSFPFVVRGARIALEAIGARPEQVAATLGAGPWRVARTITLPLAWRGIAAGAVMGYARALGEFGATILVAGNIPGVTSTISTSIYTDILLGHDLHAFTLILISVLVAFALILLSEWLMRRPALP
jgi:molybdate transport system permease protein